MMLGLSSRVVLGVVALLLVAGAARAGRDDIVVPALAPGVHAVAIYHDEADTGRLRTNWLGVPPDGVGASNNPRGLLGPPAFPQAAFTLPAGGARIVIVLVYP